jgi:hypothetical protein
VSLGRRQFYRTSRVSDATYAEGIENRECTEQIGRVASKSCELNLISYRSALPLSLSKNDAGWLYNVEGNSVGSDACSFLVWGI